MTSFKKYWEENKEFFLAIGVSEAVARKIWKDSLTVFEQKIMDYYLSKL